MLSFVPISFFKTCYSNGFRTYFYLVINSDKAAQLLTLSHFTIYELDKNGTFVEHTCSKRLYAVSSFTLFVSVFSNFVMDWERERERVPDGMTYWMTVNRLQIKQIWIKSSIGAFWGSIDYFEWNQFHYKDKDELHGKERKRRKKRNIF